MVTSGHGGEWNRGLESKVIVEKRSLISYVSPYCFTFLFWNYYKFTGNCKDSRERSRVPSLFHPTVIWHFMLTLARYQSQEFDIHTTCFSSSMSFYCMCNLCNYHVLLYFLNIRKHVFTWIINFKKMMKITVISKFIHLTNINGYIVSTVYGQRKYFQEGAFDIADHSLFLQILYLYDHILFSAYLTATPS